MEKGFRFVEIRKVIPCRVPWRRNWRGPLRIFPLGNLFGFHETLVRSVEGGDNPSGKCRGQMKFFEKCHRNPSRPDIPDS